MALSKRVVAPVEMRIARSRLDRIAVASHSPRSRRRSLLREAPVRGPSAPRAQSCDLSLDRTTILSEHGAPDVYCAITADRLVRARHAKNTCPSPTPTGCGVGATGAQRLTDPFPDTEQICYGMSNGLCYAGITRILRKRRARDPGRAVEALHPTGGVAELKRFASGAKTDHIREGSLELQVGLALLIC
jgi:hypothetical protein